MGWGWGWGTWPEAPTRNYRRLEQTPLPLNIVPPSPHTHCGSSPYKPCCPPWDPPSACGSGTTTRGHPRTEPLNLLTRKLSHTGPTSIYRTSPLWETTLFHTGIATDIRSHSERSGMRSYAGSVPETCWQRSHIGLERIDKFPDPWSWINNFLELNGPSESPDCMSNTSVRLARKCETTQNNTVELIQAKPRYGSAHACIEKRQVKKLWLHENIRMGNSPRPLPASSV